jgi:hypothetical protein
MDGGEDRPSADDPEQLYKRIESFAKHGRGKLADLAVLVDSLPRKYKIQVQDLMPELSKRISGDLALEIGGIVRVPIHFRIKDALQAKPPVSQDALRRYLREVDEATFADIADDDAILDKVKKLLPGPFGIELPRVADFPESLHGKPALVEWFMATTDKTIVALKFSAGASETLAATLDSLNAWSWLDQLHVGRGFTHGEGLKTLHKATANDTIRNKIGVMLGSFKTEGFDMEHSEAGKQDLRRELDKTGNTNDVLDAAGRAGASGQQDPAKIAKRLQGEPGGVIAEFAIATTLDLKIAIPLLASAPAARPDQMHAVVRAHSPADRATALVDDKLRKQVRAAVGTKLPLSRFFPELNEREAAHATIFGDAALREWAYQAKDPLTNLWIAAGSTSAREACKIVGREIGFDWVHKLPTTAPDIELRRFVLHCADTASTKFVREHVLGDRTFEIDANENKAVKIEPETYGSQDGRREKARLDVAMIGQDVEPANVLARLADMTAGERSALLTNAAEMNKLYSVLSGEPLMRAVYLLAPTIPQLLGLSLHNEPGLLDYIRTRSTTEEEIALSKPALIKPARALFPRIGPLVVYPSLYDPAVMARALEPSPDLLTWMLEDTDPSLALTCLAREPVRTTAAPLFEARSHMFDKLPQYKHLLPAGKRSFDALANAAEDSDSKREAEMYRDGGGQLDPVAEKHGERMAAASAEKHLWDAIDTLSRSRGNQQSALALVNNASAKERIALLDGSHSDSVENLKALVFVSPSHVFPSLTTAQLIALPDAAKWLFEAEPPYVTLGRVAPQPKALEQLAHALAANVAFAKHWLAALPEGAGLTAIEHHALDLMCAHVSNEEVLRLLFKARFGTVVDASFPLAETKRLWKVVARLPPAQVNQKVIHKFTHEPIGDSASGLWDHENVVLHEDRKKLEGKDSSFEDSPELSAAEIKNYYGLDDKALAKASAKDGWISHVNGKYKVKENRDVAEFDATVLHEVGHSVDTLLGERTDVIFGAGGWRQYGVDQFEDWAKDMGALNGITGKDRADIIRAWKDAIRAGTSVAEIVDEKHVARSKTYANDPLVIAANSGTRFHYKEAPRPTFQGRVFTTNGVYLSSVPKQTADVAPSQYAMSAPAEYFAECYVEYYRDYRGTPETNHKKGGHLASWIKEWFTKHVDSIRFSPDRLHGNADKKGDEAKPTTTD